MSNVILISKNPKLKTHVEQYLLEEDYTVTLAGRESDFSTGDLLLYDSTSFQANDLSFLSRVKNHTPLIPVIVFVNQGNVDFTAKVMRAGAVNVLEKPVDPHLLLEAIKDGLSHKMVTQQNQSVIQQAINLLQSLQNPSENSAPVLADHEQPSAVHDSNRVMRVGDLLINIKQEKAFYRQIPVDLTPTQFRLLTILCEEKGQVVPFEELHFRLHDEHLDRAASRTALSAHLSYLRNKLNQVGCTNYLENIRGRGYVLDVPESEQSHSHKITLDLMLEQLPIILWTTDDTLRITSSFGSGLAKLDLKPQDVIGMTPEELLEADANHMPLSEAYQKALRGETLTFEQKIQKHIFQIYLEPLLSDQEAIIGCIGLAFDITDRKEADETYQKLIDQSLQGIVVFQDNRIVFANPAMAKFTGYTVDELISLEDPGELIHEEDRPWVYKNIQKRLAGEAVPQTAEYRLLHKDGSLRWIEQSAFLTSFRGRTAIQTATTDRTLEKLAMMERHQMEEMYRVLVKNLPQVAVLLFDHDLRYLLAEGQLLEEAGYSQNTLKGKTLWEVMPEDRIEMLLPHYYVALKGYESTFEWVANNKTYEVRTLPVRNEDEQIIAGMFLIQDITKYNFEF